MANGTRSLVCQGVANSGSGTLSLLNSSASAVTVARFTAVWLKE